MAKRSTKGAPEISAPDDSWRAQDALRTLTRAKEIERDRELMKQVKAEAKKQERALQSVCAPRKSRR